VLGGRHSCLVLWGVCWQQVESTGQTACRPICHSSRAPQQWLTVGQQSLNSSPTKNVLLTVGACATVLQAKAASLLLGV
jgi:hypothetical protein